MRRYILLLLMIGVIISTVSAWPESFTDWNYRQLHNITGDATWSGDQSNYQVKFIVEFEPGTSTGQTCYLNNNAQSDFDDIRFATTGDTPTILDYWIESKTDGDTAVVWVEVDTIPDGGTKQIYVYYGNSGAMAASDGGATFPFFDDFPGSSLDAQWTESGTPTVSVSGGICSVYSGTSAWRGIYSDSTFGPYSFAIRSKIKYGLESEAGASNVWPDMHTNADSGIFINYAASTYLRTINEGTITGTPKTSEITTYHTEDVLFISSSSLKYIRDGGAETEHTANIPNEVMNVGAATQKASGTGYIYVDWVLTRNLVNPEPSHSTWFGPESQFPGKIFVSFSGVPISGYVPLTVYFTDLSTSENCTINTWQWSFGDSSPNSTQQNPAHTYTTSGLYNVILTVTNTSFSKTNTTQKTAYINVTVNPDAPNADFTVTETCGETSDIFYFIDFSTGGGLYAWNWSFGDGSYSELRNPTHQYSSNGTYDVGLSVWGAYGNDTLTRSNLITIPCGAATPTPTPTPTVTPTGTGNATTPVQGPAQPGRISPLGFVLLATIDFGLFFYALVDNENRNYFHIIACIAAVIVSFLCGTFLITGYITEDFVVTNIEASVNESVLSTYSVHQAQIIDAGFGYFFMFIGVVMLIIGVLASIEAFREFSSEAGGDFE